MKGKGILFSQASDLALGAATSTLNGEHCAWGLGMEEEIV